MSVSELLPSLHSLPRAEKLQVIQLLAADLARGEAEQLPESAFVLPPEDRCPYTPAELKRMYYEQGGRPLSEIWRRLGRT